MRYNTVLITIDSLHPDFVGHLGGTSAQTPTIDALAADGMSAEHGYANGIPTFFAFPAILGGRRHIPEDKPIGIAEYWETIADIYSQNGYQTAAFNAANPWLTSDFRYNSGFDHYVDFLGEGSDGGIGGKAVELMKSVQHRIPVDGLVRDKLGLAARLFCCYTNNYPIEPAQKVTDAAIDWLGSRTNDEPFFLWLHYMDPHYPWTPRSSSVPKRTIGRTWHDVAYLYNNSEREPDESTIADVKALYKDEVSNVDASIQELIDALDEQGESEDTVMCVTADHGTELGDHGGFSHGPDSLYEEVVRVPIVLSGPEIPNETIEDPVQHVDIPPTLLDVSNVDPKRKSTSLGWAGTSMGHVERNRGFIQVVYDFDPTSEETPHADLLTALIDYPWKLHWNQETDECELYDLDSDPDERKDVSGAYPDIVEKYQRAIRDEQEDISVEQRTATEISAVRRSIAEIDAI